MKFTLFLTVFLFCCCKAADDNSLSPQIVRLHELNDNVVEICWTKANKGSFENYNLTYAKKNSSSFDVLGNFKFTKESNNCAKINIESLNTQNEMYIFKLVTHFTDGESKDAVCVTYTPMDYMNANLTNQEMSAIYCIEMPGLCMYDVYPYMVVNSTGCSVVLPPSQNDSTISGLFRNETALCLDTNHSNVNGGISSTALDVIAVCDEILQEDSNFCGMSSTAIVRNSIWYAHIITGDDNGKDIDSSESDSVSVIVGVVIGLGVPLVVSVTIIIIIIIIKIKKILDDISRSCIYDCH